MATYIPDRDDLEKHYASMEGGDDTLAYAQTGEIVLPNEVQKRFPHIAAAALQAIAQSGGNPQQYIVGSQQGNYDADTNAQQFAWYDDLLDYGKKAVDWVGSSNFGQAAVTGLGTAAVAKLAGKDTTQALAAGLGAGSGYLAGSYLQQGFTNLTDNNPDTSFFTAPTRTPTVPSASLGEALSNAAGNFSLGGLAGAGVGGYMAYNSFAPIEMPKLNLQGESQLTMPTIPTMDDIKSQFEENDQANISATLPQTNPIAPMTPQALQGAGGVTYKERVKDRDTGRFSYVDSTKDNDAGAFTRALNSSSRRKGFGSKLMYV